MSKKEIMKSRNKMRKLILNIFLILMFCTSSLFAISQNEIKETMGKKIDNVLNVLQNKELNIQEQSQKIFSIMDTIFDYKVMSKIALGKYWKTLTSEEKKRFQEKFEQKLKQSYIDKLELYTNEKVKILKQKKTKKNRIVLYTHIIGKEDTYEINYKFYKNKQSDWLIYDVNIIGVSIMQTYRKQFKEFLSTKSFAELLKTL